VSDYPFVRFKSFGKVVKVLCDDFFTCDGTIVVDSMRVASRVDMESAIIVYVAKNEGDIVAIMSSVPIKARGAVDVLEGSMLYLEQGDKLSVGLKSGHEGAFFISYREILNSNKELERKNKRVLDSGINSHLKDL